MMAVHVCEWHPPIRTCLHIAHFEHGSRLSLNVSKEGGSYVRSSSAVCWKPRKPKECADRG